MIDIDKALQDLTIDEKLKLLSGKDFWHTMDYPEKGIDSIEVADGPYGLRKQKGLCDHMGWNVSEKATAYVSGPGLASSWDTDLARELGKHLAAEARKNNVDILLGPAVNIVRTPLCGRNFEYYSEDPVLAGDIALSYIDGVQSQGVGTSIKHFAANNQEKDREFIDAVVDERTLREIYLVPFEKAVKKSKPWSIMSALNKVNGTYASENSWLIEKVLREEWGFEGLTISDWSGINNRVRAVRAGLDLEMPYSFGVSEGRLRKALESGELTESEIDNSIRRLLEAVNRVTVGKKTVPEYINTDHDAFARYMAERSAVLLKNKDSLLPLDKKNSVAVIGTFAVSPRFKMDGSALVNPTGFSIPLDEIEKIAEGDVTYAPGYGDSFDPDYALIDEAVQNAGKADVAVIFAGLPKGIEAEGQDRKDMKMPLSHTELIRRVSEVQKNTVVVLLNGSPVEMDWADSVSAVLEMFLAGQRLGEAVPRLLYGFANPGGKLSVTFPYRLEQNPSYLNYPGFGGRVEYKEGVFVGYRYYSSKKIPVRYPFGFGLSYTSFDITDVEVTAQEGNDVSLAVTVTNTGGRAGSEVVQIYVRPPEGYAIPRPVKELRAFRRIDLESGEIKTLSFTLTERDFSYYDEDLSSWYAPEGGYTLLVGTSSEDICRKVGVHITPTRKKFREITGWSTIGDMLSTPSGEEAVGKIVDALNAAGNDAAKRFPLTKADGTYSDEIRRIPIRMVTVLTDNAVNNDIMDEIILTCNKKNLEYCR